MEKGIMFEQFLPNHELTQANLERVNENFRNSLRYVKHYGGYADDTATEADMMAAMKKLSSTEYGIGIRIEDDPIKEFTPFSL
mgnify:CR=1 FL=1